MRSDGPSDLRWPVISFLAYATTGRKQKPADIFCHIFFSLFNNAKFLVHSHAPSSSSAIISNNKVFFRIYFRFDSHTCEILTCKINLLKHPPQSSQLLQLSSSLKQETSKMTLRWDPPRTNVLVFFLLITTKRYVKEKRYTNGSFSA